MSRPQIFRPYASAIAMLAGLALCASPARSADISWTNASGGNWNNAANWGGTVPGPGDNAIINLDGTYTVTLDVNPTVAGLTLGGGAGVQTLSINSRTLTVDGAMTVGANGAIALLGSIQGGGSLSNSGLITARGTSSIDVALATVAGSILRIEGSTSGTATLTVANGFTNHGTLELTSSGGPYAAGLYVTSGTLVNAPGKALNVLAGAGGMRTLSAQLDNQGTVTVGQALSINKASADHVNSGTFDIAGADVTVNQSGTTPSFTNDGTLTIATGRKLTISGGAYTHGAALAGSGTLELTSVTGTLNVNLTNAALDLLPSSCTLNGPGSLVNAAGKTLISPNLTANCAIDNQGTLVFRATCNVNGALSQATGAVLRVEGSTSGTATLTVANGFTNHGTLELTSSGGAYAASLYVTSGTLVNAPGKALNVLAGAGGNRTLNAQLDNQGTVTVGQALSINKASADHVNSGTFDIAGADVAVIQTGTTPSFTNDGTLTIATGRKLTVSGGAYTHGAALAGSGTLELTSVTGTLNVNLTNAALDLLLSSCTLNGPGSLVNAAGKTLISPNLTANCAIDNQGTLVFRATCNVNGALSQATGAGLRVEGSTSGTATLTVASGFTNNGTLELTSSGGAYAAGLYVTTGTLVNAPGKALNILAGAGGARTLNAQLDNQGTVTVGQALTINKASADHVNSGTFDVAGGDVTVNQSGTTPSFTNGGTLTIATGRKLTISGGAYTHGAALAGSGTLELTSVTGTLNVNLTNAALDLLLSSCTLNGPGSLVNAAGETLIPPNLTANCAIDNQGTLVFRATCNVNGALSQATGAVLRAEGSTSGTATLTVANGFTNNGTLELTSSGGAYAAGLYVTSGTLTNAAGKALNILAGAGGSRTLAAQLDNQGTVTVGQALTINKSSADHVNSGTFDVAGADVAVIQNGTTPSFTNGGTLTIATGRKLTVSGGALDNLAGGVIQGAGELATLGARFVNAGAIDPGTSPGILTVTGGLTQTATGVLNIELTGLTAGTEFDRLVVSGADSLGGTLNVARPGGFTPQVGDEFRVLTFDSRAGHFSAITGLALGGGLSLEPRFDVTGLTLVTVGQTWVYLVTGSGPAPRDGHTAVYRAASNRMVVFGGRADGGPLNDVWVLQNANGTGGPTSWARLSPAGGPPAARTGHTAVLDAAANRMYVFGGDDASGATPTDFGDVWQLTNADGTGGAPAWTQLSPTGGPPVARTQHTAVWDAASSRMIVFGGNATEGACGGALNDVRVLDLAGAPAWTQLSPTGGPPTPRRYHGAGYDAATNRMVVFAGDDACGVPNAEVWVLAGANGLAGAPAWSLLSTGGTVPAGWTLQRSVYDAALNRLSAFGGAVNGTRTNSVLTLKDANGTGTPLWIDLTPTNHQPEPRTLCSLVEDVANARMVVFGGLGDTGRLNDTWVLEQTAGRVVEVPETPPAPTFTGFARPPVPNPSRGAMSFTVAVARRQEIAVSVYNVAGRRVAEVHRGPLDPGTHTLTWSGRTSGGVRCAAGIYLVRLVGEGIGETRRVCVVP